MYRIIALVVALPILIALFIKLIRSPKYDKWCKDLTSGKLDADTSSQDKIKEIVSTEKNLGKQAEKNTQQAEKLAKESDGINDFLGKRGVVEVTEVAKEDKEVSE
jgi:hypothetical protein